MPNFIDLTSKKFGRLTVLRVHTEKTVENKYRWVCQCECGEITYPSGSNLSSGTTKSCGDSKCSPRWIDYIPKPRIYKKYPPEYTAWCNMRTRCFAVDAINYCDYGGRGIKICKRWNVYRNFISDMGKRPSKRHSLDRIDNDGDYKPSNCRWAIPKIQAYNRRTTVWIVTDKKKYTTKDFCKFMGFDLKHLYFLRKKRGLSGQQIIDLYKIRPYKKRQSLRFIKLLKNKK